MNDILKTGFLKAAVVAVIGAGLIAGPAQRAQAFTPLGVNILGATEIPGGMLASEENVSYTREWLVDTYFMEYIGPALMLMTEQLSAVAMQQVAAIGMFLDAKHQLETQRLFQQLTAEAHKDYQPNEEMCTLGSVMRSLAASDRNAELTALLMTERSLDRQLGNANSNASEGPKEDREGRLAQFRERYCDPNDNDEGLRSICNNSNYALMNKDVDFARTVAFPMTIDADFSDGTVTDDEQDIIALASNLFSHDVFTRIAPSATEVGANQDEYLNIRSVVAKRSVAEHSFNTILGMKTAGEESAAARPQMIALLQELGMSQQDAEDMLGERPSYYAQMEILSKAAFQRPEFFVGLYDKPANVARKGVALQAIALMQDRDLFKSNMRSEAMLSVLLEMEVMRLQEDVQNRINRLVSDGPKN